jgi:hypothetical protein
MSCRVAFIGNMNNNHFSMMRYFRDLGIAADLLMYNNEADHFRPENDTWRLEKWRPFLQQLPFSNGGIDSLLLSAQRIQPYLKDYQVLVGNGIAPVICRKIRRKLDLFIPYADGIEFIVEHHFQLRRLKSSLYSWVRKTMMESAIRSSVTATVSGNLHSHAQNSFVRLNLRPVVMPIPMLYLEPPESVDVLRPELSALVSRLQNRSLVVFSHVSHIWKNLPVPHYMGGHGKRNDWLIHGFSEYVRQTGDTMALLALVEYGRDVPESKSLVEELGINGQVLWFPKMSRREIMAVLPYVDAGGSEFAGMLWGGCGWEFLASGVAMLHQLDKPDLYAAQGLPLPPFYNVNGPKEITEILRTNDRTSLRRIGAAGAAWFQRHQGLALARKFADLLPLSSR